jgi:hypothetical protein
MEQPESKKIEALERRVKWLTLVVTVLGIGVGFVSGVIPVAIFGFIALFPILVLTHRFLPGLARFCGRSLSFIIRPLTTGQIQQEQKPAR